MQTNSQDASISNPSLIWFCFNWDLPLKAENKPEALNKCTPVCIHACVWLSVHAHDI